MKSPHILVVEDERSIQTIVRTYLESAGFTVTVVDDGRIALAQARLIQPDLVVLDLNLPGMDGMEVAARLREESGMYILMLSARGEEADRVAGLRIGADDYLTKPFSPRELVARVEAVLRRQRETTVSTATVYAFQHLTINPESHEAIAAGQPLDLTATEFQVLLELAKHAGRVLTREQLLSLVWGGDYYGNDRVVDVYVGQVRRKLQDVTGQLLIETVRGIGYKFVDLKS
ncbi:response regulator transcription factor [Candidatus Leptofilum sp.]|uniref:response regulator transcription factor n=1 Tax=Candidatus Leptofilum sp. TaxID=3241576 RepID=UPI003B599BB1